MSVIFDSKFEIKSGDILERFYKAIELEKKKPSWPSNQIESLSRLKTLLSTIENCLLDFSGNVIKGELYLSILELTDKLVVKWFKYFTNGSITYWSHLDFADTLSYNLIPIISILDNFESGAAARFVHDGKYPIPPGKKRRYLGQVI